MHLEDLEPHRFEDLVRQLCYDFRLWSKLEPTGRSGSDEGFDARGWERFGGVEIQTAEESENDEESAISDRQWLIQCKREKTITPKKLGGYIDGLPKSETDPLYGIIFAAACDFSKQARDVFRTKSREKGFSEAYLWGKGEIEDQLFQPKNDHLLFAYFGISLQVRKRGLRTEVRSRLSTKRKAKKILDTQYRPALIRDASDQRYPQLDQDKDKQRIERGRWIAFFPDGCRSDGIRITTGRFMAFLDKDGEHWDYAEGVDQAHLDAHVNPWAKEETEEERVQNDKARAVWDDLPNEEKAWFEIQHVLPYEMILDIDEDGDEHFDRGPHIYTAEWLGTAGPFRPYYYEKLETISIYGRRSGHPDDSKRVAKFPRRPKSDDGDK